MKKVFSLLLVFFSFQAIAQEGALELLKVNDTDFYLGGKNAPVVIFEYSSLSCPHCKVFHEDVFKALKMKYFLTGKVQYVLRDFPLNSAALQAAKIGHCAGRDRYFDFIDTFFEWQDKWAFTNEYSDTLKKIAKLGGFSDQDYDKCIANKEVEDFILKRSMDANNILGISATPTIYINGAKYVGDKPYTFYERIIEDELKKAPPVVEVKAKK